MPTRDIFHDAVRHALEKDGWKITDDPLTISYGGTRMIIDLGAERLLAAERDDERIAVEIKSFVGDSALSEFHTALGQFLNYEMALEQRDSQRKLFLAVPQSTYETFFELPFTRNAMERHGLRLIVYHPVREEVIKWIR